MELIREMSATRKQFNAYNLSVKHGTQAPGVAMKSLGWVRNSKGRGTLWVGPRPKTEEELLRMAHLWIDVETGIRKAKYVKAKKENEQSTINKIKKSTTGIQRCDIFAHSTTNPLKVTVPIVRPDVVEPLPKRGHTPLKDIEVLDKEVTKALTVPSTKLSILWGLFKWERA